MARPARLCSGRGHDPFFAKSNRVSPHSVIASDGEAIRSRDIVGKDAPWIVSASARDDEGETEAIEPILPYPLALAVISRVRARRVGPAASPFTGSLRSRSNFSIAAFVPGPIRPSSLSGP